MGGFSGEGPGPPVMPDRAQTLPDKGFPGKASRRPFGQILPPPRSNVTLIRYNVTLIRCNVILMRYSRIRTRNVTKSRYARAMLELGGEEGGKCVGP